jgi:hypothetical protein
MIPKTVNTSCIGRFQWIYASSKYIIKV